MSKIISFILVLLAFTFIFSIKESNAFFWNSDSKAETEAEPAPDKDSSNGPAQRVGSNLKDGAKTTADKSKSTGRSVLDNLSGLGHSTANMFKGGAKGAVDSAKKPMN